MGKKGETTKNKILKAALALFVKQGIERTTTAEITQKVGIAEGTLFAHFKTKQVLIDELYKSIKTEEVKYFSQLTFNEDNPKEYVTNFAGSMCNYFIQREKEYRFIELTHKTDYISKKVRQEAEEYFVDFVNKMIQWQKDGVITDFDMQLIGSVAWSICKGVIEYSIANKQKEIPENSMDMLWNAVKS